MNLSRTTAAFVVLVATGCAVQHGVDRLAAGEPSAVQVADRSLPRLRKLPHLLPQGRERFLVPLPPGFPAPAVPADNPLTASKVELGRYLFYDRRLSRNETYSCASCHQQARAFTDGRARAVGSTGVLHSRNSMSLANVAYNLSYTWANPGVTTLEDQLIIPLINHHPVELGFGEDLESLAARLKTVPMYQQLFAKAFPTESHPVSIRNTARAIASFERTLISGRSPYDRMAFGGEAAALTPAALRGMTLFLSDRFQCRSCHEGFDFCGPVNSAETPFVLPDVSMSSTLNPGVRPSMPSFRHTGTFNGTALDEGLGSVTKNESDRGRFRVPTLRNVAVTGPYMHDGSFATLEEVVDHYSAGGPPRSGQPIDIRPFAMSRQERTDLVEFLRALTDEDFLQDPRLSDPWSGPRADDP